MKKVRFESPVRCFSQAMENSECQSPRPFLERQQAVCPDLSYDYPRILPYSPDPVQRYECSNTLPYPLVAKTSVEGSNEHGSRWPSKDLDLSMLDSSYNEPRHPVNYNKHQLIKDNLLSMPSHLGYNHVHGLPINAPLHVLSSIENTKMTKPMESHAKDNNFFIKRDNLHKMYSENINPLHSQLNRLSVSSDNNPVAKKVELMGIATQVAQVPETQLKNICRPVSSESAVPIECQCHHCVKIIQNAQCNMPKHMTNINHNQTINQCPCLAATDHVYYCNQHNLKPPAKTCNCNKLELHNNHPQNAVDKKTWTIERYEQNKKHECMEVEKQNNVTKEKREPTVSDLFKIIKLQNEQLQLLQEKVDKFISASSSRTNDMPIQSCMTEQKALETVQNDQHKISIGVMTSFEMVRTSTVINKEIVTQTKENAQIQCNRSQISIKEVVSKTHPVNLNFLDGIMPTGRTFGQREENIEHHFQNMNCDTMQHADNIYDDKTLNEISLYNVHVDNATTPLISPEQSLYLDVRDYSDSDSSNDDHSNIGWTYYNKVMTHVNGVLQDSEMPSSASALERNTQHCVQMQIDKTNVSVTKRVKFGDDPLGIHQPHIYAASTDTSLKMNQLAAKYLKDRTLSPASLTPQLPKPSVMPIDMSFATRNYMERHRLLHGLSRTTSRSPPAGEMPRFLDITALKRQPKLL